MKRSKLIVLPAKAKDEKVVVDKRELQMIRQTLRITQQALQSALETITLACERDSGK